MIQIFTLYDENLKKIDLPVGITPLDIYISSIEKTRHTTRIDGSDRVIEYGHNYNSRDIRLEILLSAYDTVDYRLLRDELYRILRSKTKMYVSESHQPGKVYSISVVQSFIPERPALGNVREAVVTVYCEKLDIPFAESIGSTQDIINNGGISYSQELWGYGMGLSHDPDTHKYEHSSRVFKIYNAGVDICPFEQDLRVIVKGVNKGYKLENMTNGSVFEYTGDTSGDLLIDGASVTIGGTNVFRYTNRSFLPLSSGWNEFKQNQERKVSFIFKYYYD